MTVSALNSTKIEYPDEDGLPMAESDFQRDDLMNAVKGLGIYFQNRPDVYVSGNLFIYYEEGNPASVVSPDVFVVFGVEKRKRRSYKTWDEGGKAPEFVLEITSMSTRTQDQGAKKGIYAFLGVREYFQYDPTGDYLNPQLQGLRLVEGNYFPIARTVLPDGTVSLASEVLELDLRLLPDGNLRFFNPRTGEFLLTHEEAEQARREAEERAQRLAAKLRELGIDPDAM
ncbi:Uma2 family endonuclease [Kamptonema formosum]|uniref:Uma2 family endonuclease n=1 Tax=Kamptonema formosum TaxID=331992 RepID=UPI00034DF9EF|nr:Uma2 family endonuclease [Oscillatoria sp. PCC 10802]